MKCYQQSTSNLFLKGNIQLFYICSWSKKLNYYKSRNTNAFCYLLDCTKAFERISFHSLFSKLLTISLLGVILRVLLYIYLHQQSRVIWNNACSTTFSISNGVRQGSILSSILFGYYMEDLIYTVIRNNIGCKIGNIFTGILVYTDDIIFLAPRREGL